MFRSSCTRLVALVFVLFASHSVASVQIVPGATWTASNTGLPVQAHAGALYQEGNLYYFIGKDQTEGKDFQQINCYSSQNLVQWDFQGALLTRQSSGDLGPQRRVERPRVIYDSSQSQYVLWMHIDSQDYSEAKVGVATSSTICGSYSYLGSWRPLGNASRDITVYKDTDGIGYLLPEDRGKGLQLYQLTQNYLNVSKAIYLWPPVDGKQVEAPAVYKTGGRYFVLGSRLTGFTSNDNIYTTATDLSGPWTDWDNFAPVGSHTFNSQTTFIFNSSSGAMYLGDRWNAQDTSRSTYVWLPLHISGATVSMQNYLNWLPSTGRKGPKDKTYSATSATLKDGATLVSCAKCNDGQAIDSIGGPSGGSATWSNIHSASSAVTTIRIYYINTKNAVLYANMTINDKTPRLLSFLPPEDKGPQISILNVAFQKGDSNTMKISGRDATYAPSIDYIAVPQS